MRRSEPQRDMRLVQIGTVLIELTPELVTTYLPDGNIVHGAPHDTPEYAQHAIERGYGDDVARSNRCHEVTHSLVAHWLGMSASPTLTRVGQGLLDPTEVTCAEEAAVLAVERYANAVGVDLERVIKG